MLLSASLRPHHLSRRFYLALVGVSLGSTFALPTLTYAAQQAVGALGAIAANGSTGQSVGAAGSGFTLPSSSLYAINTANPNAPLIETDPAFTNRGLWLSSDYMLQQLAADPNSLHRRLGDGYYEQQLLLQQIGLNAQRDIQVISDQGTTLAAQNNITIEAATNTTSEHSFRDSKTSGVFSSGGVGFTVGKQQQSLNQEGTSTTAAASTVGSIAGNTTMAAGGQYRQTGSDVVAPKAVAGNLLNNGKAGQSDASTTETAISPALVSVGGQTTDTSNETLTDSNGKAVSSDTSATTSRTLTKADMADLQQQAQQKQADNMLLFKTAVAFTDPAFKAAFLEQAKMYKKVMATDSEGKASTQWQEMTAEEKSQIPPGSRIANNGIFNGGPNHPQAAQNLAEQNSSGTVDYLVHFPQANNMVSELLIAGYQKFLEGSALGLTNATQQNVDLWNQTGGNITLDGHSRGGMTVGNALTAINGSGGQGGTTNVNLFGSAYNAQEAANMVNQMTNGAGEVKQATNNYDFVGRILGGNEGTGGVIPPGSSVLDEIIRTFGGEATVHNCYGKGNKNCASYFGTGAYQPSLTPVSPAIEGSKK